MRLPITRAALLLVLLFVAGSDARDRPAVPRHEGGYADLVALFKDWREFQKPKQIDGVPDFTPAAISAQRRGLAALRKRLDAIDPSGWPVSQRIDYLLVRAELNGMDFDHRVLRPWSRNPCFYEVILESDTDVPLREGPARPHAIELWTYSFPLRPDRLADLRSRLRIIPRWLDAAKRNLTEDAKDLYFLGARVKQDEREALAALSKRAAGHHPDLVPDVERAKTAVDDFRAWLERRHQAMRKSSGIGVADYDWYMKHVHLVPYTWREQLAIVERELQRSWAHLKLSENRNRAVPALEVVASEEEYRRKYREAVHDFIGFLRTHEIFTVPDYAEPALLAREGGFIPPTRLRDFFTQIEYRDLHPMRGHGTHWFDLARMAKEPHPSPIRSTPLLYNIWDTRAEGFATGFEEIVATAGYLDDPTGSAKLSPRVRELVFVMLAQRGARAMGALKMHSSEWTIDQAVKYAVSHTPYGWLPIEGNTVWGEQQLYLEQPGYGTSYIIGKVHIEKLLADRARQHGDRFSLRQFFDEFHAVGMIPVSMIRWEMTGLEDEVKTLISPISR
jgi:hypothetical protein